MNILSAMGRILTASCSEVPEPLERGPRPDQRGLSSARIGAGLWTVLDMDFLRIHPLLGGPVNKELQQQGPKA